MKPIQRHLQAGPGQCSDPAEIIAVAHGFGLRPLDDAGVSAARALAHGLLGDQVAPASAFLNAQNAFGAAVLGFVEDEAVTGVLSAFPLNQEGFGRLKRGAFDAFNLNVAHVARSGERPSAYYGWGFGARTKEAARAVVKASVEIHRRLYWATPTFARAVSADGLRALTSIGFRAFCVNDANLLWIAPARGRSPGGAAL